MLITKNTLHQLNLERKKSAILPFLVTKISEKKKMATGLSLDKDIGRAKVKILHSLNV